MQSLTISEIRRNSAVQNIVTIIISIYDPMSLWYIWAFPKSVFVLASLNRKPSD